MQKTCETCGMAFEAKRPTAKYCGDRCRKRAQRRPAPAADTATGADSSAQLVSLPPPARPPRPSGDLEEATARSLGEAGRLDSELGVAALLMARRLEAVLLVETGAGVAALMKEYRATLAEALKNAEAADDELDRIRGSAALKLLRGGQGT